MYLCNMTTCLLSSPTSYSLTQATKPNHPTSPKVRLEYHVVYRIYSALLNRKVFTFCFVVTRQMSLLESGT